MVHHTVRACLITNPRSGHGGVDLSAVLPVLRAHGWEPVVRQKLRGGQATELARDAVREGYDVVVNCGGDGTLREIVDGVAGSRIAVGLIPGGTENLWARELGIARRLDVAAMQLIGAARRRVDVGHLRINGAQGRHFLLMAGLGFDGAVMARVSKPLKNRVGPLAVGLAALRALPSFAAVPLHVELDGVAWDGRVTQLVVGNTRRYGGFTALTPDAYVDDGQLDVCLISAAGPINTGRQAAALLLGHHPSAATAQVYRATHIVVRAPAPLPMQIDGGAEETTEQPAAEGISYEFTVRPRGLTVLVPRAYGGSLFQNGAVTRAPLQPHPHGAETGQATGPHRAGKQGGRLLRVVAVSVDTIVAVRPRDGRPRTVILDGATVATDGHGDRQPLAAFLNGLLEGDLIRVKGPKQHGAIAARRISRPPPCDGATPTRR